MKLPVASLAFIGSPYSKQTKYEYKSAEHRFSKQTIMSPWSQSGANFPLRHVILV